MLRGKFGKIGKDFRDGHIVMDAFQQAAFRDHIRSGERILYLASMGRLKHKRTRNTIAAEPTPRSSENSSIAAGKNKMRSKEIDQHINNIDSHLKDGDDQLLRPAIPLDGGKFSAVGRPGRGGAGKERIDSGDKRSEKDSTGEASANEAHRCSGRSRSRRSGLTSQNASPHLVHSTDNRKSCDLGDGRGNGKDKIGVDAFSSRRIAGVTKLPASANWDGRQRPRYLSINPKYDVHCGAKKTGNTVYRHVGPTRDGGQNADESGSWLHGCRRPKSACARAEPTDAGATGCARSVENGCLHVRKQAGNLERKSSRHTQTEERTLKEAGCACRVPECLNDEARRVEKFCLWKQKIESNKEERHRPDISSGGPEGGRDALRAACTGVRASDRTRHHHASSKKRSPLRAACIGVRASDRTRHHHASSKKRSPTRRADACGQIRDQGGRTDLRRGISACGKHATQRVTPCLGSHNSSAKGAHAMQENTEYMVGCSADPSLIPLRVADKAYPGQRSSAVQSRDPRAAAEVSAGRAEENFFEERQRRMRERIAGKTNPRGSTSHCSGREGGTSSTLNPERVATNGKRYASRPQSAPAMRPSSVPSENVHPTPEPKPAIVLKSSARVSTERRPSAPGSSTNTSSEPRSARSSASLGGRATSSRSGSDWYYDTPGNNSFGVTGRRRRLVAELETLRRGVEDAECRLRKVPRRRRRPQSAASRVSTACCLMCTKNIRDSLPNNSECRATAATSTISSASDGVPRAGERVVCPLVVTHSARPFLNQL